MQGSESSNLRRKLNIIAFGVSATVVAALFLNYLFTAYNYESRRVQTHADRSAFAVSSLVYQSPDTWRYQEDRLRELALNGAFGGTADENEHWLRIDDIEGNTVLRVGPPQKFLEIVQSSDIREGHRVVGRLVFAESALPIWYQAAIPGAIGLLLGAAIFAALQYLPMRALLRREEQLRENEAQLVQAQKMEAIGQLTGGIAHDFNNLLGIVIGNLDFLTESLEAGDEKRELAENAVRAALRGADLTHRLLAFARKQTLRPEVVNLNGLVQGMTELLRRSLGETISIEAKLSGDLWPTVIDPAQFEAALLNLATNARLAMVDGGRLIMETSNINLDREYTDRHDEIIAGPYVMLAISDTGVGMPKEILAQAFEPFFTTREVGEGSGLGLSMVQGFVKQSHGHVSVYSEVGVGTTIKLYFRADPGADAVPVKMPKQSELLANSNETILVVEDDPDVRRLTVSVVTSFGYAVLEAEDGRSALALLDSGAPVDLLFTDVVLPEKMNGAQLAAEALRRRPGLKVLYTSGYNENIIVHNGMLDDAVDLIAKPYRRHELAQRLRAALDSRGS